MRSLKFLEIAAPQDVVAKQHGAEKSADHKVESQRLRKAGKGDNKDQHQSKDGLLALDHEQDAVQGTARPHEQA